MNDQNNERVNKKMSSRQLLRHILKRMGQQTPEEQFLDFQRRYYANRMKKRDRGSSFEIK